MNRREFTLTAGALAATPALPAIGTTAPALPRNVYAWAHMIVRAQNRADPSMLARQLRIDPGMAKELYSQLITDGVLRAPGLAGVSRAATPLDCTGARTGTPHALKARLERIARDLTKSRSKPPLVKSEEQALECAKPQGDTSSRGPSDAPSEHRQGD